MTSYFEDCTKCLYIARCYSCEDIKCMTYAQLKEKYKGNTTLISLNEKNKKDIFYKFKYFCTGRFAPYMYDSAKSAVIVSSSYYIFYEIWICDKNMDTIREDTMVYYIPITHV